MLYSFPSGTMEAAQEKKKKVLAVPENLKRKHRNFSEPKVKCLRKKFAQMFQKARRLYSYPYLN
jgi:hypothetical protein